MQKIFEGWRKFLKEQDITPEEDKPEQEKSIEDKPKRKTSGVLFNPKRGEEVRFNPNSHPDLKHEIYDLISIAYKDIGGHTKIQNPDSVLSDPDWNVWVGMDIHNDPDFDIVSFGSTTPYGIKFTGVGHDGTPEAKEIYKKLRSRDLQMDGHYVESSGRSARAFIKAGAPVINDQSTVEKILGKKVKWIGKNVGDEKALGDGWYIRTIGGHEHAKIMLGNPGKLDT